MYDVPFLIGAKKGLPNFNEFSLRNVAQLTRKLEVRKQTAADTRPYQTNLLYLVTVTNQFGVELWNSYTNVYTNTLRARVLGRLSLALVDGLRTNLPLALTNVAYNADITTNSWGSNAFILPVLRPAILAGSAAYRPTPTPSLTAAGNNTARAGTWVLHAGLDPACDQQLHLRDHRREFPAAGGLRDDRQHAHADERDPGTGGRNNLSATGVTAEPANTGHEPGGGVNDLNAPMVGIENQMQIPLGNLTVSEAQWRSYSQLTAEGLDKPKSIDRFRLSRETPLVYTSERERQQLRAELGEPPLRPGPVLAHPQALPGHHVAGQRSPVHYLAEDLLDPRNRPDDPNRTNTVNFAVPPTAVLTNSNLGLVNERFAPWGDNPKLTPTLLAYDNRVKDPNVYKSDDWAFPTNKWPSLGWIGRVHRGTPWSTLSQSGVIPSRASG